MEAVGTVNRIMNSNEVREALGDADAFSGPEMVEVKGKGQQRGCGCWSRYLEAKCR